MKKTILALQSVLPSEMAQIEDEFRVIRLWESQDPEQEILAHRFEISGILSTYNCSGVSNRMIEALPNLEIICQFGAGFDNIDIQSAKKHGISVTNTPDILTNDTADIAMILLLNLSRRTVEADMYTRVGRWANNAFPLSTSVTGKKVGIVGLGKIGCAIAKRAQAFDMTISYYGRSKKSVDYTFFDNLENLAKSVDFLVLACAGGEATRGIVDYKILEALGSKGYLINIARGSVIVQDDLLIALRNKAIAGAGLDVYADEPYVPEELVKMDNVVLLPHVGSATMETRSKMGQLVLQNLLAHFNGNRLLTPVNE